MRPNLWSQRSRTVIRITSNLNEVTTRLVAKLQAVNDPNGPVRDRMLRQVASDTAAQVTYRIHTEGKNSNDTPIGEYSSKYLKIREKNNRGTNPKVILSLTGQMENDFGIVSNSANKYGLGFKNSLNADKAEWLQEGTKSGQVKEHERIINRKSDKSINKILDTINKIEDEISDGYGDLNKLNKRLISAKKRYQKAQGKKVKVKSHTRSGRVGYGRIYDLTDKEKDHANLVANDFIAQYLNNESA